MSQEIFEIIMGMDMKAIETQLALQCAPLITGIKPSNLLNIQNENLVLICELLEKTELSYCVLLNSKNKTTLLLYKKDSLEKYLDQVEVKNMFFELGYQTTDFNSVLEIFKERYEQYKISKKEFPHEMGLLLGYPIEDVRGFLVHQGKNYLYTGYWKVYENPKEKKILFEQINQSRELVIQMLSLGVNICEIINKYHTRQLTRVAF